jgi:hypothetical protein
MESGRFFSPLFFSAGGRVGGVELGISVAVVACGSVLGDLGASRVLILRLGPGHSCQKSLILNSLLLRMCCRVVHASFFF